MVMKIKLALLLCVGSLNAADLYSQQEVMNVRWQNETIVSILEKLKNDTDYEFFYRKGLIPETQTASLSMQEATIHQVLDEVLVRNGYSYDIHDNVVLINRAAEPAATRQAQQQPTVVRGEVVTANGQPLVGAIVAVEGARGGAVTDINGRFVVQVPADNKALTVSYLGFKTQKVDVAGREEVRIVLEEGTKDIQEVIITGYNAFDPAHFTGAVTQVKMDSVIVPTLTSIEDALQGVVPGMVVINTSGLVGAAPKIRIRGTSTLYGNQSPLWVVDGVIQRDPLPIPEDMSAALGADMNDLREVASSAISWLNPMDIETITVLKDAASTAIYGSQASNGVIVITTKKARSGALSIGYSGSFAIGQKPTYDKYDMMNSQELMQLSQEIYMDRNTYSHELLPIGYADLIRRLQIKEIDQATFDREFRKMENMNTDWFDILFRNQLSQIHNVSVSGGGETVATRASVGLQNILGEARGNDMRNFTINSTTTVRLADRLTANLSLNGGMSERSGFAFDVDPFAYAMNTSRTIPVRNDDGTLFYHEKMSPYYSTAIPDRMPWYNYNILNELDNTANENRTQTLKTTFDLDWKFGNGFSLRGMFAYSLTASEVRSYATEYSNYITQLRGYEQGEASGNLTALEATVLPWGGLSINESATNKDWATRMDMNYNRTFNDLHTVIVQLGTELRSGRTYGHKDTMYGYLHYRGEKYAEVPKDPLNIGAGSFTSQHDLHRIMRDGTLNKNSMNRYLSGYLTAIYSYDRRYTVNLNARTDASNRFGQDKNKRFEPNWSVGFKWRLAEEEFFDMAWWMNMVDLGFTYGYTGNAVEGVSPYLIAIDAGFDEYYNQYSTAVKQPAYPDLGWEKKRDWNLNLDMMLFEGRLGVSANLFGSKSDVINQREINPENGRLHGTIMGQRMDTRGWDLAFNLVPVRTENFTWTLAFNTGVAKGKLIDSEQENDRDMYLGGMAIVSGEPYSTFYSYSYAGLDALRGYPTFNFMDIEPTDNALEYLVKSGKLEPDFQGGLNTMLRYKRLSLRTLFSISLGAHNRLPEIYNRYGAPAPNQNAPRFLKDRWRQPGDELREGVMPAIPTGNKNANSLLQQLPTPTPTPQNRFDMWHLSDERVANSDFIRCRNIALSWELPERFLANVVNRVSLSMVMTNPFVITFDKKWDGYDPETGDWPLRRTTTLNLIISF